jgi:hypothetical protein
MADLRQVYDDNLRTAAEVVGAGAVSRLGPLWLGTFPGGQGFITYHDLADVTDVDALVATALAHFQADATIVEVEWKTRSHDHAPGLGEALLRHGFKPGDPESVMIGEAAALAVEVPLPPGVTLRQIRDEGDIRAMVAMQNEVFGDESDPQRLLVWMREDPTMECWVAEVEGQMVCAGRLHPVPQTEFAGIWGGATRPEWRRRGIYRALTAARARSALAVGRRYIHSDSTEDSRPILERYGFVKVTETTPYEWRR